MDTIDKPVEIRAIQVDGHLFVCLHESSPGYWFAGTCSFNRSDVEATVRNERSLGNRCEMGVFDVPSVVRSGGGSE